MRSKAILILVVIGLLFASCDWINALFNPGGIPKTSLVLPAALTSSTGAKAAGYTPDQVFEPFRISLDAVQKALDNVNAAIDEINKYPIPDNVAGITAGSYTVNVSTDPARPYPKRIDLFVGDAQFARIEYDQNVAKAQLTVYPKAKLATSPVTWSQIAYDESVASARVLEGWLIMDTTGLTGTYPTKLQFKATYGTSSTAVVGGLDYVYQFNPDTGTVAYDATKSYMFQALCTGSGSTSKSIVDLYFPANSEPAVTAASYPTIGAAFGDILYSWVTTAANSSVRTKLDNTTPAIGYGNAATLALDLAAWKAANSSSTALDNILWTLDLSNPIAYDAAVGYQGHGTTVTTDYTAIGDPSTIVFPYSPAEIAAKTIGF